VVSGSSARARSRTCAQVSCASRSENAIDMRIHNTFPQRWITTRGKWS